MEDIVLHRPAKSCCEIHSFCRSNRVSLSEAFKSKDKYMQDCKQLATASNRKDIFTQATGNSELYGTGVPRHFCSLSEGGEAI